MSAGIAIARGAENAIGRYASKSRKKLEIRSHTLFFLPLIISPIKYYTLPRGATLALFHIDPILDTTHEYEGLSSEVWPLRVPHWHPLKQAHHLLPDRDGRLRDNGTAAVVRSPDWGAWRRRRGEPEGRGERHPAACTAATSPAVPLLLLEEVPGRGDGGPRVRSADRGGAARRRGGREDGKRG